MAEKRRHTRDEGGEWTVSFYDLDGELLPGPYCPDDVKRAQERPPWKIVSNLAPPDQPRPDDQPTAPEDGPPEQSAD